MVSKKTGAKLIITVVCLCISIVAIFVVIAAVKANDQNRGSVEDEKNYKYDMPPMVYVNDTLYKRISFSTDNCLNDESTYLGEIKSNVDSSQAPTENYQSNSNLIGAKIYKNGEDIVIVYNGYYELYGVLEK